MGLGIQLIVFAGIGAAPIDILSYYSARIVIQIFNLNPEIVYTLLGIMSLVVGALITFIIWLFNRGKKYIFTFLNVLLTGGVIALWGALLKKLGFERISDFALYQKYIVGIVGTILVGLGIALMLTSTLPPSPHEELLTIYNSKLNQLTVSKLLVEITYLAFGFILMILSSVVIAGKGLEFTQINYFTLVNIILVSPVVQGFVYVFNKWSDRLLVPVGNSKLRDVITKDQKRQARKINGRNKMKLNRYIDHTKLGPTVQKAQIDKLLEEAKKYNFMSVCVNTPWVEYCKNELKDTDVLVATVIGFPHGTHTIKTKEFETKEALKLGADEIDMVINVGAVKDGNYDLVLKEIKTLKKACGKNVLKVIIETCYLTDEEITKVAELCVKANADFVKTSTGYGPRGASVHDVELIDKAVEGKAEIKASGGIRTYEDAISMIEAGATRLGASKGVEIMKGEDK